MFSSVSSIQDKVLKIIATIKKPNDPDAEMYFAKVSKQLMGQKQQGLSVEAIPTMTDIKLNVLKYSPACSDASESKKEKSEASKVLIYICGNFEFAAASMDNMINLVNEYKGLDLEDDNQVVYCMDYRFRGFNHYSNNKSIKGSDKKNDLYFIGRTTTPMSFHQTPLAVDGQDQACLIRHLIGQGIEPKNITVIGHSLGGNVLAHMLNAFGDDPVYKQINVIFDRTFGALTNVAKGSLASSVSINEDDLLEQEDGIDFVWRSAINHPRTLILQSPEDGVIFDSVSLLSKVEATLAAESKSSNAVCSARISPWVGADAHNEILPHMQLKAFPELPAHVITAAFSKTQAIGIVFNTELKLALSNHEEKPLYVDVSMNLSNFINSRDQIEKLLEAYKAKVNDESEYNSFFRGLFGEIPKTKKLALANELLTCIQNNNIITLAKLLQSASSFDNRLNIICNQIQDTLLKKDWERLQQMSWIEGFNAHIQRMRYCSVDRKATREFKAH